MDTVLSAKLVSKDEATSMEITVEKVVTETRTYDRNFLLSQKAQIELDRKILAEIALSDEHAFSKLVELAKAA